MLRLPVHKAVGLAGFGLPQRYPPTQRLMVTVGVQLFLQLRFDFSYNSTVGITRHRTMSGKPGTHRNPRNRTR